MKWRSRGGGTADGAAERASGSASWLGRKGSEYLIYALTLAVFLGLAVTAIANLRARGIHAGFGFLWDTAGFDIGFSLIPFDATKSYARAFLVGLLNTLFVSLLALVLGSALGLALAIARLSQNSPLRAGATAFTEIVRNTPLLLQLFAWYFLLFAALPPVRQSISLAGFVLLNNRGVTVASPQMDFYATLGLAAAASLIFLAIAARGLAAQLGAPWPRFGSLGATGAALILVLITLATTSWTSPQRQGFNVVGGAALPPEFAALVATLALYAAAFIGEAFRSGFLSVRESQWEAARALGLTRFATLRLVILPQAVRAALPALGNQFVNVVKSSSLAAAVGFPDLMQVFGKTTLNQTGQVVEVIGVTMAVYLAISLAISAGVHRYGRVRERRT